MLTIINADITTANIFEQAAKFGGWNGRIEAVEANVFALTTPQGVEYRMRGAENVVRELLSEDSARAVRNNPKEEKPLVVYLARRLMQERNPDLSARQFEELWSEKMDEFIMMVQVMNTCGEEVNPVDFNVARSEMRKVGDFRRECVCHLGDKALWAILQ